LKGLELSEYYYNDICAPMLREKFPQHVNKIAVGLVGEGSECFGFDDEISKDHDFGPTVCIWINKEDYKVFGEDLVKAVSKLPKEFMGFEDRNATVWSDGRRGVFQIGEFYKKYIGIDRIPATLTEWRSIPEINLSIVSNGKIFTDPLGEFSRFREVLMGFYPEDIRLKKIAARCMKMAQSGQYNYPRSIKRKEFVAARLAEAEFIDSTISMIYLINRRYKPFYKWMHKGMKDLSILGKTIYELLEQLVSFRKENYNENINIVEKICELVIGELRKEGLTNSKMDFLLEHGIIVHKNIKDDKIRNTNPWID
jgi:hypothetical protein